MTAPVRMFAVLVLMAATWLQVPLAAQSADTTPPSVSITSPAPGEQVGRNVNITADVSDAVGVKSVTFTVDGIVIAIDQNPPYQVNWTSKGRFDGQRTLRAEARDIAGNAGFSAPVTIVVGPNNAPATDTTAPAVSITSPAGGAQVAGTVAVAASASDAVGVISVRFFVDGALISTATSAPWSVNWNTTGIAAGSHTLRAEARDAAGNVGTSATVTVNVSTSSSSDTTAPAVSLTAPAGGTQVTGTVAVTATATDAVGVTSVTFFVDGAAIGSDTSSPYSVNWNTAGVAAGSHALRAEARDAAGNVGVSATVTVSIAAANRPPAVTLTAAPTNGGSLVAPAAITLTANASDPDGTVSRVDFYDGSTQIGSDSTSPFSINWTASAARTYAFGAVAVDNLGATASAQPVSVTVTAPSRPSTAVFVPSTDNANVTQYVLDVFRSGSDPATTTPVATQDLGKPPVVNGEMTADIARTTASLAPATYVATVTAVTPAQRSRSAASPAFVIAGTATLMTSAFTTLSTSDAATSSVAPVAGDSRGVVWATNASTGLVTAFNAMTGDVLATIPVGLTPAGIAAPDGAGKIYVADEGSDTVSVISKSTMTLARTIPLPAPSGRKPRHVSASPDGRFVYVGESGANVVDVIDTATDQISARFSTGWPGSKTHVVAPDPTGAVVYAVNRAAAPAASTLVALDAESGRWLWHLPLAGDPGDFIVAPDGRTGLLTLQADSRIDVIDLERHAVVKHIGLAGQSLAGSLEVAVDGGVVLITSSTMPAQLGLVELATMTGLPPVSLAATARGLALSAEHLSYVPVAGSDEVPAGVVAVDTASRTVVRRFRLTGGGAPYAVVFDRD